MKKSERKIGPLRRTVNLVVDAAFLFIVVCLVWVMVSIFVFKQPSLFGYRLYTVATPSMEPALNVGDMILTADVKDPQTLEEGDIVTFIAPEGFASEIVGQPITHRVSKAPYEHAGVWYIQTKGDNNASLDPVAVPLANVRGIVVGHTGAFKGFAAFLSQWYGFLLVILVPLLMILIIQFVRLGQYFKGAAAEKRQKDEQEIQARALEKAKELLAAEGAADEHSANSDDAPNDEDGGGTEG